MTPVRRLVLLRHAKAASPANTPDRERPLSPRGRRAVPLVAAHLADEGIRPDLALVSPAQRTRETWDLVRSAFGEVPVRFDERIYEASTETLLALVREIEPEVGAVLLVGHNPGFGELARTLAGDGERDAMRRLSSNFPTASAAALDFSLDTWQAVGPLAGRLERFVTPKTLALEE